MRTKWMSLILGFTLTLDWATKYWARNSLGTETYAYFGNFFVLEHHENTGAFLSLGSSLDQATRFWIFTIGIALLMVALVVFLFRNRDLSQLSFISYALILAGGIGNLADRILKESVTDFINLGLGPVRTGVFNIADMAIMAGTFLLVFESFKDTKKNTAL